MSTTELKSCAQLFLDAAYNPELLGEALLKSARLFGGEAAQLVGFSSNAELISDAMVGIDENEGRRQGDYMHIHPRFLAINKMQEGDINYDYSNLSHSEIQRDVTYQELIKPNKVDWYAGSLLVANQDCKVAFGLFRDDTLGHFSKDELKDFKWLSGRVGEYAKLALKLDQMKTNAAYEALGSWNIPVAALSGEGNVVSMSPSFLTTLRQNNLGDIGRYGVLKINDKQLASKLKIAVPIYVNLLYKKESLTNTKEILHKCSDAWVGFTLHPISLSSRWTTLGAAALLSLRVIRIPTYNITNIQSCLGLTRAEAELAKSLALGVSLAEAAKQRTTSYDTVRSQIKSVYSKTGCNSQTELALLVQRLFPNG